MSYQVEVLYKLEEKQNPKQNHSPKIILRTFDTHLEAKNYFDKLNSKNIDKEIVNMGKVTTQQLDYKSRKLHIISNQVHEEKKI